MDEQDTQKLRDFFARFECSGVVSLIDYLSSPKGRTTLRLGSSTIGLGEIMNEIWLSKEDHMASAWFRTKSLHIGSNDGSVTPLQWLEKLSEVFDRVSKPAQKRFDERCREFARIPQLKPEGDVDIYSRKGRFRIPAEDFRDEMTDAEMERYRIT